MDSKKEKLDSNVTIMDVAKHAGVGVTTVSRVINNKDEVNEETRKKVLQSISELNYSPKAVAQLLGRGGTMHEEKKASYTVGLIAHESMKSDPYFVHILDGVERELSSNGISCIFSQIREDIVSRESSFNEYNLSKLLMEDKLDCIIGVSIRNIETVELFKNTKLPLVFIDTEDFEDDIDYIKADNLAGAKKAVSYLASLGHKRIAYIRGELKSWFFNDLEEGYIQALKQYKLAFDPQLIVCGEDNPEAGYSLAIKLLELAEPPTAIFTDDITAIGVINAVKEKGMEIPRDISVVGFDDIDAAAYIYPTLTTVQVPKYEIGVAAARKAVEHLKNNSFLSPVKTLLATKLVIRGSTGNLK
jgi:DNA-binding LacI/PurR family transcriptional regulator